MRLPPTNELKVELKSQFAIMKSIYIAALNSETNQLLGYVLANLTFIILPFKVNSPVCSCLAEMRLSFTIFYL